MFSNVLLGLTLKKKYSLYQTGLISDKEIVTSSGFLKTLKQKIEKTLKQKIEVDEMLASDVVMADKGFHIEDDLKKITLNLNIPPFLEDKENFSESDLRKVLTVAQHRIHIERAIGKVRKRFFFQETSLSVS